MIKCLVRYPNTIIDKFGGYCYDDDYSPYSETDELDCKSAAEASMVRIHLPPPFKIFKCFELKTSLKTLFLYPFLKKCIYTNIRQYTLMCDTKDPQKGHTFKTHILAINRYLQKL